MNGQVQEKDETERQKAAGTRFGGQVVTDRFTYF